MKRTQIKRTVTALAVVVFSGAIGTAAMAQVGAATTRISRGPRSRISTTTSTGTRVAQRLANPQLVNDPRFLAAIRGSEVYGGHPGVREEIHESPGQFMYREGH